MTVFKDKLKQAGKAHYTRETRRENDESVADAVFDEQDERGKDDEKGDDDDHHCILTGGKESPNRHRKKRGEKVHQEWSTANCQKGGERMARKVHEHEQSLWHMMNCLS